MAQFVVLAERDMQRFTEADFTPLLDAEAEAVRVLYGQGVLRAAHGRGDVPGAVLIIEAADRAACDAALATLPLAAKGMLKTTVIPTGPYRGFGPRG